MAGLAEYINPSASTKQKRYERGKGFMDSVDDFIAPVTGAISGAVYDFEDAVTPFIPPELRHLPLSPSDIGGGALTLAQMINPLPMIDQAMTDSGDAADGTQTVAGADGQWYDRELTLDERAGLATGSAVEATAAVLPAAIYGRVMGSSAGSAMTEALTGYTAQTSDEVGEGLAKAIAKQTGKPKEGMTRRTFNKGAAATVAAGGAAVGAKNTIGDVFETVGKRAVKVAPKVIDDFGGRLGDILTRIKNTGDMVDFHDMEAGASQGGGNLIPNDYHNLRELLPKDADGNLLPRDNGRGGFYEGEPEFGEVHDWMMENDIGGPYKAYWDDANAYEGSYFGAQTELVDLVGEVDEAGFRESLKELSSDELEDMSVELDDFAANRWAEDNNFEPQDRQKIQEIRKQIADEVGRRDNLGDEVVEEVAGEDTFFKDVINTRKARLEKEAAEAAEELAKQQADQVWFEKYLPVGWKTGGF